MKTRFIVFACIAMAIISASLLMLKSGPGSSVHLPDGSEVRIIGVSPGTNQFTTDRPWYRLARRTLPDSWQGWIPKTTFFYPGVSNTITVWLQVSHPITHTNYYKQWGTVETINDFGEVQSSGRINPMRAGYAQGFMLTQFPRRQSSFLFRLYETNGDPAAVLRVPNPLRGPFPNWTPDPLPLTRTNGDLAVTVKSLTKIVTEYLPGKTNVQLHPEFEFSWKSIPTMNWTLLNIRYEDATGNTSAALNPGLSFNEPAWHMRCWFKCADDSTFQPGALFLLTNLPVLSAGTHTNLGISTDIQGLDLDIAAWSAAATLTIVSNQVVTSSLPRSEFRFHQSFTGYVSNMFTRKFELGRPALIVAHAPRSDEFAVTYILRDDQGRHLKCDIEEPLTYYNAYGGGYAGSQQSKPIPALYFVQPVIPSGCKSISVLIFVDRFKILDFFIEPPRTEKRIAFKK